MLRCRTSDASPAKAFCTCILCKRKRPLCPAACEFALHLIMLLQQMSAITGSPAASRSGVHSPQRAGTSILHKWREAALRCKCEIERAARRKRTLRASARFLCCANAATAAVSPSFQFSAAPRMTGIVSPANRWQQC